MLLLDVAGVKRARNSRRRGASKSDTQNWTTASWLAGWRVLKLSNYTRNSCAFLLFAPDIDSPVFSCQWPITVASSPLFAYPFLLEKSKFSFRFVPSLMGFEKKKMRVEKTYFGIREPEESL